MQFVDTVRRFQAQTRLACLPVGRPINPFAVIAAQRAVEAAANAKKRTITPAVAPAPTSHTAVAEEPSADWMLRPEAYSADVAAAALPPETVKAIIHNGPTEGAVRFALALENPPRNLDRVLSVSTAPTMKSASVPAKEPEWKQRRAQARADRRHNEFEFGAFYSHARRVPNRVYYLLVVESHEECDKHDKWCDGDSGHKSKRNHGRKPRDRHPRWLAGTFGPWVFAASRAPVVGSSGYHTPRRLLKLVESWEKAAATVATAN